MSYPITGEGGSSTSIQKPDNSSSSSQPAEKSSTISTVKRVALRIFIVIAAAVTAGLLFPHIGAAAIGVGAAMIVVSLLFLYLSAKGPSNSYAKESGNLAAQNKLKKQTEIAVKEGTAQQPQIHGNRKTCDGQTTIKRQNYGPNVSISHTQGRRPNDEDAWCSTPVTFSHNGEEITAQFHGVFDGHGDDGKCAQYVAKNFPEILGKLLSKAEALDEETITNAITQAVEELDTSWVMQGRKGGTTVTGALILNDKIYFPNVGDSRTLLVNGREQYQLTEDAKPTNKRFSKRAAKMGLRVVDDRIDGRYAVARDIGIESLYYKPKITWATAGGERFDQEEKMVYFQEGNYLVIACDGLWDVLTNQYVGDAIRRWEKRGKTPHDMASRLVERAYFNGSTDNISAMVVKL